MVPRNTAHAIIFTLLRREARRNTSAALPTKKSEIIAKNTDNENTLESLFFCRRFFHDDFSCFSVLQLRTFFHRTKNWQDRYELLGALP